MKSILKAAAMTGALALSPCRAEPGNAQPQPQPQPPPTGQKPEAKATPDLSKVVLSPPPKARSQTRKAGRNAALVTRNGTKDTIKLVALAPSDDGVTLAPQPRLWWWQSNATAAGELEFVLSKLVARREQGQPSTVLSMVIGPLPAGFNAIDLSHPLVNPKKLALEEGAEYQWSVGHREGISKDAFFVRMRRVGNEEVASQWAAQPLSVPTLNALSGSGNWYELFDTVASSASLEPGNEACIQLRQRLLTMVGLESAVAP